MLKKLLFFGLLLSVTSCVKDDVYNDKQNADNNSGHNYNFLADAQKGWVRIKLTEQAAQDLHVTTRGTVESGNPELDRLAASFGATFVQRTFSDGGKYKERRRKAGLHLWYDLYFDEEVPVTKALTGFSALPEVSVVEPIILPRSFHESRYNYLSGSQKVSVVSNSRNNESPVNDPLIGEQWHYNNTGQLEHSVQGADINLYNAWTVNTGHPDVIVAIIDGGVQWDHEDLAANMWVNEAELYGQNGQDDDDNGYIDDIYGWNCVENIGEIRPAFHGTHVAGTVGAVNNNGTGVAGVAGGGAKGQGVRLMSCQIFPNNSPQPMPDEFRQSECFLYAADNGAVIAQCSWGNIYELQSVRDAMLYFIKNAGTDVNGVQTGPMKGGIVIVAAGNDGENKANYPGGWPEALTVTAIGPDMKSTQYTNYGEWVDIAAPGGSNLYGTDHMVLSTSYPDESNPENYRAVYGTSMAAPHVSGVAALVISEYGVGKPGFTPEKLKDILLSSTKEVIPHNDMVKGLLGIGTIDAYYAVRPDAGVAPDKVTDAQVKAFDGSIYPEVSWKVPADSYGDGVRLFKLFISLRGYDKFDINNLPKGTIVQDVFNSLPVASTVKCVLDNYRKGFTYTIAIVSYDVHGNYSDPVMVEWRIPLDTDNVPEILRAIPDVFFSQIGEEYAQTLDMSNYFGDPDYGDYLFYDLEFSNSAIVSLTEDESEMTFVPVRDGVSKVVAHATDLNNNSISQEFNIVVNTSTQPIDIYPTRVTSNMYIFVSDATLRTASIIIYNNSGQKVYSTSYQINNTTPAVIDLAGLKTGSYIIKVNYNNSTTSRNFTKI